VHSSDFESTLAKLRPVIGEMADAFWLSSLFDPEQQQDIHAVAKAMAAELLGETYGEGQILLEPPQGYRQRGAPARTVTYADRRVCTFGLRESDLPQHLLILGRSGPARPTSAAWSSGTS